MDFSNQKFRCSSLGDLMTNQQGKKDTTSIDELSETCKKQLVKIYVYEKYGRDKEIVSKYLDKGIQSEEDSLTLYSLVKGSLYMKNKIKKQNEFLTGEMDWFEDSEVIDFKSSWDIHTFFENLTKPVNKAYYLQLQGYSALTGAQFLKLAYCLVDTPEGLIEDEKRKLFYKMNVASMENPEYLKACEELEHEMRFTDIPKQERVIEFSFPRDEKVIECIYQRVPLWRQWLSEFAIKM